jgi:hypothetical protein
LKRAWRVLALAAASLGCAHGPARGSDLETGYRQALQSWTSHAEVYQIADQRAYFYATLESRIYRQQRARERSRELGWPADRELAEVSKDLQQEGSETSFIVAVYTDVPRENDLGDVKSLWRVALRTPAGELVPTVIDRLGRPDENMQTLYPYMDRYSHAYRIHFPKVTQGPVTLFIASGIGQAELKFDSL